MKLVDWESNLQAVLDRYQTAVFKWGVVDCASYAFDGIKAVCGLEVPENSIQRNSLEEYEALCKTGFKFHTIFDKYFTRSNPISFKGGELGLTDPNPLGGYPFGSRACCLSTKDGWFVLNEEKGLISIKPKRITSAWDIK